eukprot:CAMPEP_0174849478 /NCGR_PEP_ID=MMETSP1114-20130205/16169_1 /TAXON_ID=312471 /ORGANISM="Neobodo designis, Strain CCAP 1951/1" /LENGTH=250 /DNA_ID=CAMNT_0016083825 /DNA_START=65 /DNA_END=817 /DNA_ORIENTATION=-
MASFDIPSDRRGLVVMAKVAEQCERYDEMLVCMKRLARENPALTLDERNLLSVAYKYVLGGRRTPWRTMERLDASAAVQQLKEQMVREIGEVCNDVIALINDKLLPAADGSEAKVFFHKMAADYHRYHAEVLASGSAPCKAECASARKAYEAAQKAAADIANKAEPIVLGLMLNYSVFLFEIEKEQTAGYELAKATFESGIPALNDISEDETYAEAAQMLELMQDNIENWASALNIKKEPAEDAMEMEDM